ncbi:MAG: hypothetical protein JWO29_1623 [Arthrobacter sp.]|nr:hypothetical protein [Arthrobacter sp.]
MVSNPAAEPWNTHQLLAMAARLVQRSQDQALASLGLTHAAVIALQGLASGPLSQEQLAAQIKVQAQTIGKVLVRLDSAGLITRTRDPKDRRRIEAALTSAGRTALENARDIEQNLPLNRAMRSTLEHELVRVIDSFSITPGDPASAAPTEPDPVATDDDDTQDRRQSPGSND